MYRTFLLFKVGDLLVVIKSSARNGGSFNRGGSPNDHDKIMYVMYVCMYVCMPTFSHLQGGDS